MELGAQLPWVSQYREYRPVINPAALSNDYVAVDGYYNLAIGLSHRNEGLPEGVDVPNTQLLQVNWASNHDKRFQLLAGAYVMRDQFGPTRWTNSAIRLGSFLYDQDFGLLSLGLSFGFTQWDIKVTPEMFLSLGDQAANDRFGKVIPNLGFGLFYSKSMANGHDYYVGFSVPQLFDLDRQSFDATILSPQYYGLMGANLYLSSYGFIEPSIWVKYLPGDQFLLNSPLHIDLNVRYHFDAPFWLGIGVSTQETIHGEVGFDIGAMSRTGSGWKLKRGPFFRIGMGYDLSFSALPNFLDNSMELNVAYFLHR